MIMHDEARTARFVGGGRAGRAARAARRTTGTTIRILAGIAFGATAAIAVPTAAAAAAAGGAVDEFTIGYEETVSPGVPGPGAGEIERPGNQDVYDFEAVAGDRILFDNLETSNNSLRWRALAPDGTQLFSAAIFSDPGPFVLDQTGTWSIIVDDNADAVGTYSFTLWETTVEGPYVISVKDVVAPGQPAAGAGEIEEPGDQDVYELDVLAGQRLFFDNLDTSNNGLRWSAFTSGGEQVFSAAIFSSVGPIEVEASDTWTIIVDDNADQTGTYSFTVWETAIDGPFVIGIESVVEPGVPAPGAGEIEEPGDQDVYELDVLAGQRLFFDNLDTSNNSLRWSAFTSGGEQVFSAAIFSNFGPVEVESSDTWTIIVDDNADQTGTYSFTVWETTVDGPFVIGIESVVEPGVPAPGAGEIEEPGDQDVYEFTLAGEQRLFFQNVDTSNNSLRWRLFGPDEDQVFSAAIFSDVGPLELGAGTYRVVVDDNGDATGTYSFIIWDTNIDGPFAIQLETLVEPGVPGAGAGEIEDPGDLDRYTFAGTAGQPLFFQNVDTSNNSLRWRLLAPDGEQVFSAAIFSDLGPIVLEQDGTYEVQVDDNGDATGTYSFVIWETDDDQFALELNQVVDVDVPGPGAGWIEQPGNVDRYLIQGQAGDEWCAVNLATDNNSLMWRLVDPEGGVVFQAAIFSDQASLALDLDGTYVLEVFDNGDAVGTYSLVVNLTTRADVNGDCVVGFDDLLAVLAAWGPCEDPGDCPADIDQDGTAGFSDVLQVLSNWTQ